MIQIGTLIVGGVVGTKIKGDIIFSLSTRKKGEDVIMWKPTLDGVFSTSVWEVICLKSWKISSMEWIWNKLLPKEILYACGRLTFITC